MPERTGGWVLGRVPERGALGRRRDDGDEETTTTSLLEARVDVDVDAVERGDETRDANEAGERRVILATTTTTVIGRSVHRSVGR